MTWWQGLVLGLVQGLTEFLPISSSGHLVVAEALFELDNPGVLVEVALHVATLAAILVVYRQRLWALVVGVFTGDAEPWRYVGLLTIATIPAAVIGIVLSDVVKQAFDTLFVVAANFVVTAAILWSSTRAPRGGAAAPTWAAAVAIGFAQAVAILPGISRSGTTIVAALWLGVSPVHAAQFSFLMAIPAIGGAALLEGGGLSSQLAVVGGIPLAIGALAAAVAGIFAIRTLVAVLRSDAFHRFAPYCLVLGLLTLVLSLTR